MNINSIGYLKLYIVIGPPTTSIISTDECLTCIRVKWASDSDDICGQVLYSIIVSNSKKVITVNTTYFTVTGLSPATDYTITIHSTNNAGYSVTSTTATTTGRKCI